MQQKEKITHARLRHSNSRKTHYVSIYIYMNANYKAAARTVAETSFNVIRALKNYLILNDI